MCGKKKKKLYLIQAFMGNLAQPYCWIVIDNKTQFWVSCKKWWVSDCTVKGAFRDVASNLPLIFRYHSGRKCCRRHYPGWSYSEVSNRLAQWLCAGWWVLGDCLAHDFMGKDLEAKLIEETDGSYEDNEENKR